MQWTIAGEPATEATCRRAGILSMSPFLRQGDEVYPEYYGLLAVRCGDEFRSGELFTPGDYQLGRRVELVECPEGAATEFLDTAGTRYRALTTARCDGANPDWWEAEPTSSVTLAEGSPTTLVIDLAPLYPPIPPVALHLEFEQGEDLLDVIDCDALGADGVEIEVESEAAAERLSLEGCPTAIYEPLTRGVKNIRVANLLPRADETLNCGWSEFQAVDAGVSTDADVLLTLEELGYCDGASLYLTVPSLIASDGLLHCEERGVESVIIRATVHDERTLHFEKTVDCWLVEGDPLQLFWRGDPSLIVIEVELVALGAGGEEVGRSETIEVRDVGFSSAISLDVELQFDSVPGE